MVSYKNINGGQIGKLEPLLNPVDHPNEKVQRLIRAILGGQVGTAENKAALAKVSKAYQGLLVILRE